MQTIPSETDHRPVASSGEENTPALEVFSTCPSSSGGVDATFLKRVQSVAQWSERQGCRGMLIYTDNRLVDPWMLAQIVVQSTSRLMPLVAVQPLYMHPYTVANMVGTFAALHGRGLYLNWVAGGFKNDRRALADDLSHDAAYDRLVEYATIVRRLTDGESVTFHGQYYNVDGLSLRPEVDPALRPRFVLAGSSPAGNAAARAIGARPVTYALPPDEMPQNGERGGRAGLRVGIIAREDQAEAWRVAYLRFPPERMGALTRELARKVSDSHWHEALCELAARRAGVASPYWMGPFENYKTQCPYLVGSHDEVSTVLARYVRSGFHDFILDEPRTEEDLVHARVVLDSARRKAVMPS